MFRAILIFAGVVSILMGVALLASGFAAVAGGYLVGEGVILTLAMIFERWRYRKKPARGNPDAWRPTGERFIDPESGQLTEVRFNPATGERAYVPVPEETDLRRPA